jgi:hypothetical protein
MVLVSRHLREAVKCLILGDGETMMSPSFKDVLELEGYGVWKGRLSVMIPYFLRTTLQDKIIYK